MTFQQAKKNQSNITTNIMVPVAILPLKLLLIN